MPFSSYISYKFMHNAVNARCWMWVCMRMVLLRLVSFEVANVVQICRHTGWEKCGFLFCSWKIRIENRFVAVGGTHWTDSTPFSDLIILLYILQNARHNTTTIITQRSTLTGSGTKGIRFRLGIVAIEVVCVIVENGFRFDVRCSTAAKR